MADKKTFPHHVNTFSNGKYFGQHQNLEIKSKLFRTINQERNRKKLANDNGKILTGAFFQITSLIRSWPSD